MAVRKSPAGRKKGGRRTGGRAPGTPNKRSAETAAVIERALGGQSPLDVMATLAKELLDGKHKLAKSMTLDGSVVDVPDRPTELHLAAKLLADVAQYHSPKRKAIEHSAAGDIPIYLAMNIPDPRKR